VLDRVLPDLVAGKAHFAVQDLSRGGYFRGRKTDDGRIDWSKGAREIHDLVRAVAPPYPGAFTMLDDARVRFLRTRVLDGKAAKGPARLRVEEDYLVADCADGGRLRIIDWDVDGAPQDARTFAARFGTGPVPLGETA